MSDLTIVQVIVGIISLVFIMLNYKKIHEYHLNTEVKTTTTIHELPVAIEVVFRNPTSNSIRNLRVSHVLLIGERFLRFPETGHDIGLDIGANDTQSAQLEFSEDIESWGKISRGSTSEEVDAFIEQNPIRLFTKYSSKRMWFFSSCVSKWEILEHKKRYWRHPTPEEKAALSQFAARLDIQ